jgi:hypothetical protein
MANAIGNNGGRVFSFGSQPVLVDCNFIVDSTNGNGLGIRSLKGQGVRQVYMATSASMTGTVATSAAQITSISGGTSSLLPGMPVAGTGIPAGTTITQILSSSAVAISNTPTGNHSSETITYVGVGNPMVNTGVATTSEGYAWIHLRSNYNRYLGGFSGFVSPPTGSTVKIDATDAALTVGKPYTIATVGVGPQGAATIAPVADSSGSLASTYFMLYDSYGNSFCIYCIVNGVGGPPNLGPALSPAQLAAGLRGLSYQPLVLATNASAATITTALSTLINSLPSGINGTYSFTTSGGGTSTLTVTSTLNAPLAGVPQDGSSAIPAGSGVAGVPLPIWFTISSGSATAGSVWTDGSGNLYTVATTLSSGTTLKTTGTSAPSPAAGTLTFVSGTGSTTALNYSAASSGLATGWTFAQTVSDTNLQDWVGVGLPAGLTPTPNQSFIATATGSGGSTGTVYAAGVSGISSIEVIGDPNQSLAPQPTGGTAHPGGWILMQFLAPTVSTGAFVSPYIPTAPANNSVVGMSFYVDAKQSPSNAISH